MRLLIILSIVSMSLLFSGCAKSGGGIDVAADSTNSAAGGVDANNPNSKSLFSVWSEETNLFNIDFRSAQFGVSSTVFISSNTVGSCQCQVVIQGSQTGGTMVFSSCTNGAAGCISLKPTGSYTKSGSALQICTNTSCINMK